MPTVARGRGRGQLGVTSQNSHPGLWEGHCPLAEGSRALWDPGGSRHLPLGLPELLCGSWSGSPGQGVSLGPQHQPRAEPSAWLRRRSFPTGRAEKQPAEGCGGAGLSQGQAPCQVSSAPQGLAPTEAFSLGKGVMPVSEPLGWYVSLAFGAGLGGRTAGWVRYGSEGQMRERA